MRRKILTYHGYDFFEVASALQKTIRRANAKYACYFAMELHKSGFSNYCWKRLLTIGAEDVEQCIQKELVALHYSFCLINKQIKSSLEYKGRIFITKAVIMLCKAIKSRETDHYNCILYDKHIGIDDNEVDDLLREVEESDKIELPGYVFDCHTMKGRRSGKTKDMFFLDEHNSLNIFGEDMFLNDFMAYIDSIEEDVR